MLYQVIHFWYGFMSKTRSTSAHPFGEIEPHVRMGTFPTLTILSALLINHVGQHRTAQLALIQPECEGRQVGRESLHMLIVVKRVAAQIVTCQFARTPRLVKGMT